MPLVEPGKKAPALTLPDQNGTMHTLKEYAGRPVIMYFYPKDDTSGCTKEACAFRDILPKFTASDAVILGISPDDVESHAKFVAKHDLNFTLLADVPNDDGTPPVCNTYGVWQEKSMYGRQYMGIVRTTYLIDENGRVARRWDNVRVPGHAEEVLDAVNKLKAAT